VIRSLVSTEDGFAAININDDLVNGGAIASIAGVGVGVSSTIEAIDTTTGNKYSVVIPDEMSNSPIYLVGTDIPLKITAIHES
jgi:hypothetical protein